MLNIDITDIKCFMTNDGSNDINPIVVVLLTTLQVDINVVDIV